METFTLYNDIIVYSVTADSFPDGIVAAHKKLHSIMPFSPKRRYFGISHPEFDEILYKAAGEELTPGEGLRLGLEPFRIKRGKYACITVQNYRSDTSKIGATFHRLLDLPTIDPDGYCLECYISDTEMRCMVPIRSLPHTERT